MSTKAKKIIKLIITIISVPFIILSLIFIGIGSYSFIIDNIKGKDYIETTAKFKEYKDCYIDNNKQLCYGIYEYKISYSPFNIKTNYSKEKESFEDSIVIKYNPNNYKEYIIKVNKINYLYKGLSILMIVIFIKVLSNIILKDKKIEN